MNDEWNRQRIEMSEDEVNRLKVDEQEISTPPRLSIDEDEMSNLPMQSNNNNNSYHALAHASALISVWFGGMAFLGPLLVWLLLKDNHPSVEAHAKEALNFQITLMIVAAILFIPLMISLATGLICLVFPLLFIPFILSIIATVKAANGEFYRYPLTWRFIK